MKDALGHGSNANGEHSAAINNLPSKGTSWSSGVSDATWHAQQPIGQYTGHIADLLGMWGGEGMKPSPLSDAEKAQVNTAYEKRIDPHLVAGAIRTFRHTSGPRL